MHQEHEMATAYFAVGILRKPLTTPCRTALSLQTPKRERRQEENKEWRMAAL